MPLYEHQIADTQITPEQARTLHHTRQQRLPMWIIYRPTIRDYPGKWLTRLFLTLPELERTHSIMIAETKEALLDMLPEGLTNIGRTADDDPVIEEVWL